MYLTNDMLTVWELAHRLAASDPHKRYWFGLPLPVKDNIRLLMNEIFSYRLTSSLIMEKHHGNSDLDPEDYVRYHLDDIYSCLWGHGLSRKLAKSIVIDRWDFWQWCQQSRYELPDFWFGVEYQFFDEEDNEVSDSESEDIPRSVTPREENRKTREQCRVMARELWGDKPSLPIAQVARVIQERGLANHFGEKTVVSWIRNFAPKGVQGRSGRPKKS